MLPNGGHGTLRRSSGILIGACALAASAAATHATVRESTTTPHRCASTVNRSTTRLAPGAKIVATSMRKGRCRSWIAVIGGTARDIWGFNYNGGLWRSTDDLRTWRLVWQGTPGLFVERALRTASGRVLIEVGDRGGRHRILRSTTRAATRFKQTFALPAQSYLHFTRNWGQYNVLGGPRGAIYVGEYGPNPNPVHLWRSTDDGRTFQSRVEVAGRSTSSPDRVRHFHGVFVDPITHWLWAAIGDNGPEPRIGYSQDGGQTFTWISRGLYPQSRAVALMFAPDAVYWATDVPEQPGAVYRWDRRTGGVTSVLEGLTEPYFDVLQARGWFAQISEISTKTDDGYIGDDHIHLVVGNGSRWQRVTTPWTRGAPQYKVAPLGLTLPDRAGCSWLSFPNLKGSDGATNVKLCLGP